MNGISGHELVVSIVEFIDSVYYNQYEMKEITQEQKTFSDSRADAEMSAGERAEDENKARSILAKIFGMNKQTFMDILHGDANIIDEKRGKMKAMIESTDYKMLQLLAKDLHSRPIVTSTDRENWFKELQELSSKLRKICSDYDIDESIEIKDLLKGYNEMSF